MTPSALWRRWRFWILGAAGIVLLLLLSELRLRALVRRRTADLQAALAERDRLAASEENVRSRLSRLERMGAVSQLCAIVAHELKQPVGAVINYLAVASLKTGSSAASPLPAPGTESQADPVLITAIDGADMQARRIARIVDRVRGYARAEKSRPVRLRINDGLKRNDLTVALDLVEDAIRTRKSLNKVLRLHRRTIQEDRRQARRIKAG